MSNIRYQELLSNPTMSGDPTMSETVIQSQDAANRCRVPRCKKPLFNPAQARCLNSLSNPTMSEAVVKSYDVRNRCPISRYQRPLSNPTKSGAAEQFPDTGNRAVVSSHCLVPRCLVVVQSHDVMSLCIISQCLKPLSNPTMSGAVVNCRDVNNDQFCESHDV